MTAHDYLVEMTFAPFGSLLSPQEVVTFAERFVLPTLEACQQLKDTGRIVAGGTALAAVGFTFIARADSPQELEEMAASLPLWPGPKPAWCLWVRSKAAPPPCASGWPKPRPERWKPPRPRKATRPHQPNDFSPDATETYWRFLKKSRHHRSQHSSPSGPTPSSHQ